MVRKGCQKSCKEAEENGTVGGIGKGHHNTEYQHKMLNHTQVKSQGANWSKWLKLAAITDDSEC